MRTPVVILILLLLAGLGFVFSGVTAQQQSTPGQMERVPQGKALGDWLVDITGAQRKTKRNNGQKLDAAVRPNEKNLDVEDYRAEPFAPGAGPDALEELREHTRLMTAAVVVRVVAMNSKLTPDESWMQSEPELQIVDILKNAPAPRALSVGQVIRLRTDGGVMDLKGARVRAKHSWADLPEAGKEYLYFLNWTRTGAIDPLPETATFEITPTTLRRLQRTANGELDVKGIAPSAAFAAIRAAALEGGAR